MNCSDANFIEITLLLGPLQLQYRNIEIKSWMFRMPVSQNTVDQQYIIT